MNHQRQRTPREAIIPHSGGGIIWTVNLQNGTTKDLESGSDFPKNMHEDVEFFVPAEFVCKDPSIFTKTKWSEFRELMRVHDSLHPIQSVELLKKLQKNLDEYDYNTIYSKWLATKDSGGDGGVWSKVNGDILEMHVLQRKLGQPILAIKNMPSKEKNRTECLFIRPYVKY